MCHGVSPYIYKLCYPHLPWICLIKVTFYGFYHGMKITMKKATMWEHTVLGRNPANHLGCIKPCNSWEKTTYQTGAGFLPSTVSSWWFQIFFISKAAVGLDGVSRWDILNLVPSELLSLTKLFRRAPQPQVTGLNSCWPRPGEVIDQKGATTRSQ